MPDRATCPESARRGRLGVNARLARRRASPDRFAAASLARAGRPPHSRRPRRRPDPGIAAGSVAACCRWRAEGAEPLAGRDRHALGVRPRLGYRIGTCLVLHVGGIAEGEGEGLDLRRVSRRVHHRVDGRAGGRNVAQSGREGLGSLVAGRVGTLWGRCTAVRGRERSSAGRAAPPPRPSSRDRLVTWLLFFASAAAELPAVVLKLNTAVSTSGVAEACPGALHGEARGRRATPRGRDRCGRTGIAERKAQAGAGEQQRAKVTASTVVLASVRRDRGRRRALFLAPCPGPPLVRRAASQERRIGMWFGSGRSRCREGGGRPRSAVLRARAAGPTARGSRR